MTIKLELTVDSQEGRRPLAVELHRMFNTGGTMRDPEVFRQHLEELEKEGVSAPKSQHFPPVMPLTEWALFTGDRFTVHGEKTSGEVEYVLLHLNDRWYIGTGSDHTDRDLEKTEIIWSKQVCPNVLASVVWPLEEVEDHFDDIILESDVGSGSAARPYQRTTLATFWPPQEMLRRLEGRIPEWRGLNHLFFTGTAPTVNATVDFDTTFTIRMIDPVLKRRIEHTYHVEVLKREGFVL